MALQPTPKHEEDEALDLANAGTDVSEAKIRLKEIEANLSRPGYLAKGREAVAEFVRRRILTTLGMLEAKEAETVSKGIINAHKIIEDIDQLKNKEANPIPATQVTQLPSKATPGATREPSATTTHSNPATVSYIYTTPSQNAAPATPNAYASTVLITKPPVAPTSPSVTPIVSPTATPSSATTTPSSPAAPATPASSKNRQPSAKLPATSASPKPKSPNVYGSIDKETGLSASVQKMLETVLRPKELIKANLPVCRAIDTLIRTENMDVQELQRVLTNPELLQKDIDRDVMETIDEEMGRLKIDTKAKDANEQLRKKLLIEKREVKREMENRELKNTGLTRRLDTLNAAKGEARLAVQTEIDKLEEELATGQQFVADKRREIERIDVIFEDTKTLSKFEKRTATYKSPREVLGKINIYLTKDGETVESLWTKIEEQVENEKTKMRPGLLVTTAGRLFLPSLKSTLKALSKDTELAKSMGTNAEDELAKLSSLFGGSYDKVKDWADKLPGDIEKHMETTIPRLIAYLELATRDGKARYLAGTFNSNRLITHLRKLQHEHIRDKIEEESVGDKDMNDTRKMLKYIEKINEAERKVTKLNKRILSRNTMKSIAVKGGTIAGLTGAAMLSPLSLLSTLPAFLSAPAFIASYTNRVPKQHQSKVRSAAIRASIANGLALGGSALGAVIWAPLAIPLAGVGIVGGLVSPEIGKRMWRLITGKTGKSPTAKGESQLPKS